MLMDFIEHVIENHAGTCQPLRSSLFDVLSFYVLTGCLDRSRKQHDLKESREHGHEDKMKLRGNIGTGGGHNIGSQYHINALIRGNMFH